MSRERDEPARPYRGLDYHLVRAGSAGTYWRAAGGMEIRLAAAERERGVASSPSVLGVLPLVRALVR